MIKTSKTLSALCAAIGLAGALGSGAAASDTWKMQTLWTSGSINQKLVERFAKDVDEMTGGEVRIKVFPVGAVVPFTETLEAVGRGILEAEHTGSVYFAGSEPAMALIGDMNGAYENSYQLTDWFYYGGGLELAREVYERFNLYYVGPVSWGMGSVPTKKRVERMADFKGVKMRVVPGMGSDLMTRLGASTVTMPGSEVFSALDKGVIDATQWGTLSMNEELGFYQAAKFSLTPGFYSNPAADFAVNLDTWNELEPEVQKLIEMAVRDLDREMTAQTRLADLDVLANAEARGLTLVDWSEEERRAFREEAAVVWKDWSARSELAGRVYESHVAFLTKLGLLD